MQNEVRIVGNIDNFKALINPEVTRKKEYNIMATSPSNTQFFPGQIQNQNILQTKGDSMLHTVTNEFLEDSYPTTKQGTGIRVPRNAGTFRVDPNEFKAKLAKKIEELQRL